ncbi:MAG: putative sugar O-methyltransferase [Rugosibacter sp.]|nr:putative sugar O-methyltransferase [Rugosibacter sp.]
MNAYFQNVKLILDSLATSLGVSHGDAIAHSYGLFAPNVPSRIIPDVQPNAEDKKIAGRLLRAYRLSTADNQPEQSLRQDIWTKIRSHQPMFFEVLQQDDPAVLAAYLCNMSRHDATSGTVQGRQEYIKIRYNPLYRRFISLYIKDKLVSLAEAVGAIACENPEQGSWGKNLHIPAGQLIKAIEKKLATDITPPVADGGLLKISGGSAQFHERDLNAIYTAWNLANILKNTSGSVCEIGAGAGRVAYWGWRFGIGSYSIIDLPHINVIQGFYLLKALPDAPIRLYGEPEITPKNHGITVAPTHDIQKFPPGRFDLVLNQDSFPEIHADTVRDYLLRIREISKKYFLSINHESRPSSIEGAVQLRVQDLIDEVGAYQRLWRMPYWLRQGYVMELYSV